MLRNQFGSLLVNRVIHDNLAVTESSGHAQSVIRYKRSSKGAKDYIEAAAELLAHVGEPSSHIWTAGGQVLKP
jgi:cellulose biosynthesis protein BcsQ